MNATIDAVSLIFILKIPALKPLFQKHFKKIYITTPVREEVFENKISEELVPLKSLSPLFELKNPKKQLQTKLGDGELSAIALASEENLVFISEDKKAKGLAKSLGIQTASILAVLIKSKENGENNEKTAKDILFTLSEKGLYMSSELFTTVLKKLE